MPYNYDGLLRCRKGFRRKKLRRGENSRVPDCSTSLRIIIRVIATLWFIRNHACWIQSYCFTVEYPGWPCTATFVDKEQMVLFFTKEE